MQPIRHTHTKSHVSKIQLLKNVDKRVNFTDFRQSNYSLKKKLMLKSLHIVDIICKKV